MILLAAFAAAAVQPAAEDGDSVAGPWRLLTRLPLVEGPVCVVRAAGAEVNLDLILNKAGEPILIAARPDWRHGGEAEIGLTIDGDPPRKAQAQMVANLVLIRMTDVLLERLKQGKSVELALPFGRFRAGIAEFGAAFAALKACQARIGAPRPATA